MYVARKIQSTTFQYIIVHVQYITVCFSIPCPDGFGFCVLLCSLVSVFNSRKLRPGTWCAAAQAFSVQCCSLQVGQNGRLDHRSTDPQEILAEFDGDCGKIIVAKDG